MSRVLCFGELLMRMSPQLGGEWIANHAMPVFIGGAELNTATALAKWNIPVSYCTALPDNYLAKEIVASLENKQIDTSRIHFDGSRIGAYYLPQGTDLKGAGVIYDRAYSSFWELAPGQLNWDEILQDVSWFNFSAISPALNKKVAAVCLEGAKAASEKGITISIDLNYRSKLWQYGQQPVDVMPELLQYCDVVMGNIWAEEKMLGIAMEENMADDKAAYLQQCKTTAAEIQRRFPKCKVVANTFRFDREEGLHYYAALFTNGELYVSGQHQTNNVVDRVGSGDTFMAGIIWGNYHQHSPQEIIDFAAAAAFNKLFIKGDATTASVEEITKGHLSYA